MEHEFKLVFICAILVFCTDARGPGLSMDARSGPRRGVPSHRETGHRVLYLPIIIIVFYFLMTFPAEIANAKMNASSDKNEETS